MVLKLKFTQNKTSGKETLTDWARLGGDVKNAHRLELIDLPAVLVRPTNEHHGLINYHHKNIELFSDNSFFYGTWPQKKVPFYMQRKLNKALLQKKIRNNGFYYTLNGVAHQEYLFEKRLYVLVENEAFWMEVLPVKWILDEKNKKVYSEKILIADTEKADNFMGLVFQQILQMNKYVRQQKIQEVNPKAQGRQLESDVIRDLRCLRDFQKSQGKVAPEVEQIYQLFMNKVHQKKKTR